MEHKQHEALKPIMYELGVVVYLSHLFEIKLSLLLSFLQGENDIVDPDSVLSSFENITQQKITLGRLVNKLKSKIQIPHEIDLYISEAIHIRNEVIHNFVRKNQSKFLCEDGRLELISYMRKSQVILNERILFLEKILSAAIEVMGGDYEKLRQDSNKMFKPNKNSL